MSRHIIHNQSVAKEAKMTGADAIDHIAGATGTPCNTVLRMARAMREADTALWPAAGRGGGRNAASVTVAHAVNLLLAVAVADPATDAPRVVPVYAAMVKLGRAYADPDFDTTFPRLSAGTGAMRFGDVLAHMLATPPTDYDFFTVDVGASVEGRPFAELFVFQADGSDRRLGIFMPGSNDPHEARGKWKLQRGLTRTTHIGPAVFTAIRTMGVS